MLKLDIRFTPGGIQLAGPVGGRQHKMLLQGFKVREVQPGVLNVQAQFDATDNEAGATLLRQFLGFIGSQPARQQPGGNGEELGTLDDRNDLEQLDGEDP